jgi:hypothetical protein
LFLSGIDPDKKQNKSWKIRIIKNVSIVYWKTALAMHRNLIRMEGDKDA